MLEHLDTAGAGGSSGYGSDSSSTGTATANTSSSRAHPGVRVRPSSASRELYSLGRGDAVSSWEVGALSVHVLDNVDSVAWFKVRRLQVHVGCVWCWV